MSLHEHVSPKEYLLWLLSSASIDHDNTVCNTKGIVTEKFNEEFGTKYQPSEISQWQSLVGWAKDLGMNEQQAFTVNHRYWYDIDLISQAKPNPGAIEFLEKADRLAKDRHLGGPIINSSRPYSQLAATVGWYREHAPFIKPEQIVVGLPDIVVAGDAQKQAISKCWYIKLFGCPAHIEDVTAHAKIILDTTDAFVFLLSDDTSLDKFYRGKLMRFGGLNGNPPDMTQLARLISS
jgi:hypothetical protein